MEFLTRGYKISLILSKFSFSEEARLICTIFLMVLMFTKFVNVKTIRTIVQIFVASEKLNFDKIKLILYPRVRNSITHLTTGLSLGGT